MPFDYFDRLTRRQQATYRRSDAVAALALPAPAALQGHVRAMGEALLADDLALLSSAVEAFVAELMAALKAGPVATQVLPRRPSSAEAELHGLYTREEDGSALLQVWMRTAANARPVAHRTFVRTLLHECCHHLDFELLHLEDTFHTEGFFRRESSLVRQLLPGGPGARRAAQRRPAAEGTGPADDVTTKGPAPGRRRATPGRPDDGPGARQLELFDRRK